eukprot:CAMPEP_0183833620 /NCGR_PEP_ID=MMETSP0807_2-20130328/6178_1 /TAXON_ID=88271 /ORGANISM="Picocystis salinarum, Strain CCMP1897" /LENGTH=129 /DNA_ID=CAMNT_0026079597 /DNA_START=36 /DNA_END=422 /DNA_ORIENTATION=+
MINVSNHGKVADQRLGKQGKITCCFCRQCAGVIEFREGHASLRGPPNFHVPISVFQPFGQEGELICCCAHAFPRHGRTVFGGWSPRLVIQSIVPSFGEQVHGRCSVRPDRKIAVLLRLCAVLLVACVCA